MKLSPDVAALHVTIVAALARAGVPMHPRNLTSLGRVLTSLPLGVELCLSKSYEAEERVVNVFVYEGNDQLSPIRHTTYRVCDPPVMLDYVDNRQLTLVPAEEW